MRVLVTGAASPLGVRVVDRLGGSADRPVDVVRFAPDALPGATVLVHLSAGDHDSLAAQRRSAIGVTDDVLEHAALADVCHIVLLSSAMVYGAWPNNPVPLPESAPLRPDEQFGFASQLAQVEQRVESWRHAAPGRSVSVLRPVLTLSEAGTGSLVRALAAGMGTRLDEDDPPGQFLHLDDLADAIVCAVDQQLDGVFNVAPDGWVAGETVRALAGTPPRVRFPSWLVEPVADLRWRFQRGPIPPGLRSYAQHPWLVANDRLKDQGWTPSVTNEQAYVEGTEARWWTMLTPKRKQELSLAALGAAFASAVGIAAWAIRRSR